MSENSAETNNSTIIISSMIDKNYSDYTNLINKENSNIEMQDISSNAALTSNQENISKENGCCACCVNFLSFCKYICEIILILGSIVGIYMVLYTIGYYSQNINCDIISCIPFLYVSFYSFVIVPLIGVFCIIIVLLLLAIVVSPIICIAASCYD